MKPGFLIMHFIIIFASFNMVTGQDSATFSNCKRLSPCIPLPKMFVFSSEGKSREKEFSKNKLFNKSKYKRLLKINTIQDKDIFITSEVIFSLIDKFEKQSGYKGIRIYFARYNTKYTPQQFTNVEENKLVLLFSPEINPKTKRLYYLILSDDKSYYSIPESYADNWISYFVSSNMPSLVKTINKKDLENYPDAQTKNGLSDTQTILYSGDNIDEAFKTERCYQLTNHGITITGLKISFSSFDKKGKIPGRDPYRHKKRLLIQFQYVKNDHEVFSLQDQEDYKCRLDLTYNKLNMFNKKVLSHRDKEKFLKANYLDNGQLCPPTNCPR